MSRERRLFWSSTPPQAVPAHPYRDSALVYAFYAVLVVLIAWLTGGPVVRAVELAAAFFVATVAWSWFRWHQRITRQAREEELL